MRRRGGLAMLLAGLVPLNVFGLAALGGVPPNFLALVAGGLACAASSLTVRRVRRPLPPARTRPVPAFLLVASHSVALHRKAEPALDLAA